MTLDVYRGRKTTTQQLSHTARLDEASSQYAKKRNRSDKLGRMSQKQ